MIRTKDLTVVYNNLIAVAALDLEVPAGEAVRVDLSVDDPADRVRVIYVPTPPDVAAAMVELAGVTREDVVYEPGCGDARITVAAIRGGAPRGPLAALGAREFRSPTKGSDFSEGALGRFVVRLGSLPAAVAPSIALEYHWRGASKVS